MLALGRRLRVRQEVEMDARPLNRVTNELRKMGRVTQFRAEQALVELAGWRGCAMGQGQGAKVRHVRVD
jgi:hypothetical protein